MSTETVSDSVVAPGAEALIIEEKGMPAPHPRHELHELASRYQRHTPEEKKRIIDNMIRRWTLGLPPLEEPILLFDGKIVDGRHRYEYWMELAEEGVCDGYFAKNQPPFVEEKTLPAALLRSHSRNLCHRNLTADQIAAQLLLDIESMPELKAIVERIEADNKQRMKAGVPLDNKSQGSSTNEQLGQMVNVSGSTIKMAKKILNESPEELSKVAQGEKTAKAVIEELRQPDKPKTDKPNSDKPKPLANVKVGDAVFTVRPYQYGDGDYYLTERIVKKDVGKRFVFEDGDTIEHAAVYDRKNSAMQRKVMLMKEIEVISEELKMLRKAEKKAPQIVSSPARPTRSPKDSSQVEAKQTV